MKEEEFNDFLRDRADSFELKPSSGSFDAVERKIKQRKKRRGILFILPLVLLGGALAMYFTNSDGVSSITAKKEVVQSIKPNGQYNTSTAPANTNAVAKESNASLRQKESSTSKVVKPFVTDNALASNKATVQKDNSRALKTDIAMVTKNNVAINNTKANKQLAKPTKEKELELLNNDKPKGDEAQTSVILANKTANKELIDTDADELAGTNTNTISIVEKSKEEKSKKQVNEENSKKCHCNNKNWAIKASYSPFLATYSRERLNTESSSRINIRSGLSISKTDYVKENLNTGFNIGGSIELHIANRWRLGLGFNYSRWDMDVLEWTTELRNDSVASYSLDPVTNAPMVTYSLETYEQTLDTSYSNVEFRSFQIPLSLGYNFLNRKRFSADLQLHGALNYLVSTTKNKTEVNFSNIQAANTNTGYNYDYRKLNVNIGGGVMAYYRVAKCFSIYAGPRIETTLFSIQSQDNKITQKPIFIGVETGIRLRL